MPSESADGVGLSDPEHALAPQRPRVAARQQRPKMQAESCFIGPVALRKSAARARAKGLGAGAVPLRANREFRNSGLFRSGATPAARARPPPLDGFGCAKTSSGGAPWALTRACGRTPVEWIRSGRRRCYLFMKRRKAAAPLTRQVGIPRARCSRVAGLMLNIRVASRLALVHSWGTTHQVLLGIVGNRSIRPRVRTASI